MAEGGRPYRLDPLERRGLVAGFGLAQVVTLAAGLLAAVLALRSPAGIPGAVAVVGVAGASACWPIAGRPPVGWLPVVARWSRGRVASRPARRRPPGGVATLGHAAPPAGVRLLAAPDGPLEPPVGVVHDRRSGTWAAVLPVTGRAFSLLDDDDKRRRLATWGAVLASMARTGSPVHRIQWVERTRPAGLGAASGEPAASAGLPPGCADSYRSLLAEVDGSGCAHEVLVVVSVHPRRAGRQLRTFGRGRSAICSLLRRELRLLHGQLVTAGIDAGAPLDVAGLAAGVRFATDPEGVHRRPPETEAGAWPLAWSDRWSCLRADGRWHATYWIAEWPRRDVGPDFLTPVLLAGGARSVSVTMAPVPADQAAREVESARTAEVADAELRRKAGFLQTARQRRQAQGVAEREAELANGHAALRFSGYVTVSAESPADLDGRCSSIEATAHQAGLQLRRLFGQQAEAFTWTLPLGRGLA